MLEGAHTKAGPLFCFTRWYTMVADVTVLPVPGGPCTHQAALTSDGQEVVCQLHCRNQQFVPCNIQAALHEKL